jgi:hypothetical protein
MKKTEKLIFFSLLFFQLLLLFIFVFFRFIDADEGVYLTSASLVREGKLPYLDFFYPQMPFLPYLYSFISQGGMSSLFGGRVISAFLNLVLGLVLFFWSKRILGKNSLALILFFLFSFNGFLLTWQSVIKTYSFSNLASFVAFIFLMDALIKKPSRAIYFFLAGLFLGLGFSVRLIFLPLFLLTLLIIFVLPKEILERKVKPALFFIFGFIISSGLAIYFLFSETYAFIFENFTYHRLWGINVVETGLHQVLISFLKFAVLPQNLVIIGLSIFSLVIFLKKKTVLVCQSSYSAILAFLFALTIIISYLFVRPPQNQYYVQALPFLIFASAPAVEYFLLRLKRKISILIGAIYLLGLVPLFLIFIWGIREKDKVFHLSEVKKVVTLIQKHSNSNDQILSSWPGYVVLAQREPIKGAETVGYEVIKFLSSEEIQKLKLISWENLKEKIFKKEIPLIVGKEGILDPLSNLIKQNYQPIDSVSSIVIYKPKE